MAYRFDPELVAAIPGLPSQDLSNLPAARAERQANAAARPVDTRGVSVRELHVTEPLTVRVYTPEAAVGPLAAVLLLHGGGWVLGSLVELHPRAVALCRELGAVIVAPEYRLAPEHPFPTPFEDCWATLNWLAANAAELGVDPARIAVHGNSAGANLSAAVALRARDEGGPTLRFQCLCSPVTDDRLATASMRTFTDTPGANLPFLTGCWDRYLGAGMRGTDAVSAYAAPARADDLSGLPPAYVNAMEFDPLRDEGIAYARALLAAGVATELHVFPGAFHGSYRIATAAVSRRELAEIVDVLRRALS
jgi:acetyl esterase/lipase